MPVPLYGGLGKPMAASRARFVRILSRSIRLLCPRCGQGRLFDGLFRMAKRCGSCGFELEREPGFYLGAIYFNYGLTAMIVTIAYPLLVMVAHVPRSTAVVGLLAFVV
ncbi:MAG TPA: DUF983 domain-containing protein, partial [Pirellulaceae bacterium]